MASDDKFERKRRRKSRSSKSKRDNDDKDRKHLEEGADEETPAKEEDVAQEANDKADGSKKERTVENQNDKEHEETAQKPAKRKRKRKRKSKAASNAAGDEKKDEESATKLASLDHTVYVEGIPFECTEEEIKEFFVSNGISDILQMRLPRWQDTGRLRGYGHVVFQSETSRSKALNEVNGKNMKTRYITIKEAKTPKPDTTMGATVGRQPRSQPQGCNIVFCKNLPYDATEDDLREVFAVCGKIVEGGIRVARNYQTRQSKGFAYIEYKNPEGADAAVQKASKPFGMCVMGRPCFVDYEEEKMKGSFKTKDGRLWSREYKRNIHTEVRK